MFYARLCADIFAPKNYKAENVSREKLLNSLLYEKRPHKMLMKLTPDYLSDLMCIISTS